MSSITKNKLTDYNAAKAILATRTEHKKRFRNCQAGSSLTTAETWLNGTQASSRLWYFTSLSILASPPGFSWTKLDTTKSKAKPLFPELFSRIITGSSVGKESTCHVGDPGSIPGSERSPGEGIDYPRQCSWASLVAQLVENPPVMRETWVRSLCWEDPLEKGNATHSSILAWRIKESDTTERLSLSLSTLTSLDFQDFTLPEFNPTSLITVSQAFVQNPLLHPDPSLL